jgi:N-acetylglucosaminyl-diphospho-decaprenol L-rhamnosyltransferase
VGTVVLFASYSSAFGGAERLLVEFASGVPGEVAIACPPGPLQAAAQSAGLRTFHLRERSLRLRGGVGTTARALGELAGHARELRALCLALAPEVLVAWSMRSALAATAAPAGALTFQHNDFLPGSGLGALVRGVATRCALVTAPSRAVLAELDPRGRLGGRGQVIAPGVDLDAFAAAAAAPPGRPGEILVLGALTGWKRPEFALEVLARVREAVPSARLRFAGAPLPGDGDGVKAAVRRRAAALGIADAVELAGAISDVPAALARCSCLLHCAEREPFGSAIAEALAAGRPAIVPDAAGPAEIVDGGCGHRYPPGDAGAAAAAVVATLADPPAAAALGAAGRARAAQRFEAGAQRARYGAALAPLRRRAAAPPADLAVLTVTHNSAGDLAALMRSLDRHLPGVELVVADCASTDGSRSIAGERPGTTVLELANVGFGRACNAGLAAVRAPVTALLNPDVELLDDSLRTLAAQALAPGPARLLAPLVLNPDGSRQDTVHPAPLSAAEVARALVPPAALPGALGVALAPWRSGRPRRVGWAVGCAVIARTATLRALGPFDPRIFLLGEDMELGLRAARQGIETWFWPAARVLHHGGHSIEAVHGGEPFELRARARHAALELARGRGAALADDGLQAVTFASRAALKRLLGRGGERERRQLAALRGRRRG